MMRRIVVSAHPELQGSECIVVCAELPAPSDFVALLLHPDELVVLALPRHAAQSLNAQMVQRQAPCFARKYRLAADARLRDAGWVDEETFAVGEHLFKALGEVR